MEGLVEHAVDAGVHGFDFVGRAPDRAGRRGGGCRHWLVEVALQEDAELEQDHKAEQHDESHQQPIRLWCCIGPVHCIDFLEFRRKELADRMPRMGRSGKGGCLLVIYGPFSVNRDYCPDRMSELKTQCLYSHCRSFQPKAGPPAAETP